MKGYNLLKLFIVIFIVFYFISGLSTEVFLPGRQKDIPPFFSWFLFQWVPDSDDKIKFDLRITKVGEDQLNPPVLFEQAYGVIDNPASPKARELINMLGQSLDRNRDLETERLRRILEQIYLPKYIQYQIVTIKYNPVDFYKTGKYKLIKSIPFATRNYTK